MKHRCSRLLRGVLGIALAALAIGSTHLAAAQQLQAIAFGRLADQFAGAPPFTLSATATSGLPVAFSSLTSATCRVSGMQLWSLAPGACTVRATQGGNASYLAATPVDRTFTVGTTSSGPLFVLPVDYAVDAFPDGIVAADFNGDGRLDLAAVNWSNGTVSILLGRGDGTFAPAVSYGTGVGPMALVAADFNGDGKPDLAVANLFSQDVTVLLGRGDGTFAPGTSVPVGAALFGIAAGDLNGDGKVDIAVTNGTSNGVNGQWVFVLTGNGTGGFQVANKFPAANPTAVAIRDVNGDSRPDLVFANADTNSVSVLLSTGNGSFAAPVSYGVDWYPDALALADLNGDGKPDLVTSNAWSNSVSVLLNRGDGTFAAPTSYPVGSAPTSVIVGDFTGDGKVDIALVNQLGNDVMVLPGNGNGTFQPSVSYGVLTYPQALAGGDFNGDGKPDLAVAAASANAVSVLLRPSSGATPSSMGVSAGNNQSVPINSSFPTALAVIVRDAAAQPIPGVIVTFTAPASGASGRFNGSTSAQAASGSNGVATAPALVANGSVGSFNVVATSGPLSATFGLSNTGAANVAPTFTSAAPPNGTYGVPYTHTMTAAGSPAPAFAITSGALPAGLTLNAATGVISGTPSAGGIFAAGISARNGIAPDALQTFTITIAQVAQTITFGALAPRVFGSQPFLVSATASSGLPVALGAISSAVCSVTGSTVTLLAAGTCTVRATQPGNAQYAAAPNVDQSFTVAPGGQVITFGALPSLRLNAGSATLYASASSGLPVAFVTLSPGVCSIVADVLTPLTSGTCSIRASQGGNGSFNPAPTVDQSIAIAPALQTITFWPLADRSLSASPAQLSATASSGLPVTFMSLTPAVCSVSGSNAALLSAGTCTVRAAQAGNAVFASASADQRFAVASGAILAAAPPVVKGPFVEYATFIGGFGHDRAFDVLVGADGSAYVGGSVGSTNFPGLSSRSTANAGLDLLYVAKLNPNAGVVDYVTAVGARAPDITGTGALAYVGSLQGGLAQYTGAGQVEAIARDPAGVVYVAAYGSSVDFPSRGGTYTRAGSKYVYRVTASGTVQTVSGALDPAISTIRAMAVDAAGNVYLTGVARPGLVTTPGAAVGSIPASSGSFATATAPYLVKLTAGVSTAFATYLSAPGSRTGSASPPNQSLVDTATTGYALAVDAAGNSYVAGQASAIDFPVTAGSPDTADLVNRDAFVVKVDATGKLVFVARLGGNDAERATGIGLSPVGDIVIAGKTATQPFNGTTNAFQRVVTFPPNTPLADRETAFVAKLSADGKRWMFVGALGTSGGNLVNQAFSSQGDALPVKVAVDGNGAIYVTGTASSSRQLFALDTVTVLTIGSVQVTQDNVQPAQNALAASDSRGAFLLKLAPDGSYVTYAALLGSGIATGLAVDGFGSAYVTGYDSAGRLVVNAGQATTGYNGSFGNPFVVKLNDRLVPLSLATGQNPATSAQRIDLIARTADARYPGTVDFFDGAVKLGTSTVVAGAASLPVTFTAGVHRLRAIFHGTGPFDGSASVEVIQVVNPAPLSP